jgi:hypothetical protein
MNENETELLEVLTGFTKANPVKAEILEKTLIDQDWIEAAKTEITRRMTTILQALTVEVLTDISSGKISVQWYLDEAIKQAKEVK